MTRERTTNDLTTPESILELVRALGPIYLDPCANEWGTVHARMELDGSEGRDGLAASWSELSRGGLVYCNPPYGRGHLPKWSAKIFLEAKAGCEIIALVPSSTGTGWWEALSQASRATCFVKGRLSFGGGAHGAGTFDSAIFYAGPSRYLFAHLFSSLGDVVLR